MVKKPNIPAQLQTRPGAPTARPAHNAPAVYRPATAKAAQPKMSVQSAQTRLGGSATGVIQAYILGRPTVLQRMTRTGNAQNSSDGLQRKTAQAGTTIQRKGQNQVDAFRVGLRPKSGGQMIPDQVRTKMESALGTDFSDVRIHVGPEAASIGALAYTWGTNIHFAPGQYNPHSIQGQKVLGHELWHVVQQKSGRVSNPFGDGVAVVQDYALEAEADRMGLKAAMMPVMLNSK